MTRKFVLKARKLAECIDFIEDLNEEQRMVVTAPGGSMLIVAGAGCGKTRILIYRLAWLVKNGIDPGRIMLVTFTNRAAREMLHRVELLVDQIAKNLLFYQCIADHFEEFIRMWQMLQERLHEFGLELSQDKRHLIAFGKRSYTTITLVLRELCNPEQV